VVFQLHHPVNSITINQLTADGRRFTPINQRLDKIMVKPKKVNRFIKVSHGVIGVYPLFSAVNFRLSVNKVVPLSPHHLDPCPAQLHRQPLQ
jgi:hypothetical protein